MGDTRSRENETYKERSIDVEVNGKMVPVFQESAWGEEEDSMIGLVRTLGVGYLCTLTEKPTARKQA